MISNYLKSALRNFLRHKSFTALNIIGLSLGIASSLLILQYVKYERSFDTFHSKANDIYRIQYNGYQSGKLRFECAAAVRTLRRLIRYRLVAIGAQAVETADLVWYVAA